MSEFDASPAAEAIWLQHLSRRLGGDDVDFAQLLAAHPRFAPEFERLQAEWVRATQASAAPEDPASRTWDERLGAVLERLAGLRARLAKYEIRGEIGRGGMGVVRRVWDESLRRELAMKTLRVHFGAARERALARFVEEAQVLAQLDHPAIVPIHDLGLDERGQPFFVMKLVVGRDLGAAFALARDEREGWSTTRALDVLLRVCEAVGYAHRKGVLHRDLKPSNVMVGDLGEVYVMDWGIARVLHDGREAELDTLRSGASVQAELDPLRTGEGAIVGTVAYMAPEQARAELANVTTRSDVYAVGAMLYELLSGGPPYARPGASGREMLHALLAGPPPSIESLAPSVPDELAAICAKAMARDAAQRYADMAEVAVDLRAYLEGRVVRAHRTDALVRAAKWMRRNRSLALALAAGTLIGVGSIAAQVYQARIAREREELLGVFAAHDELARLEEQASSMWPPHPDRLDDYVRWQSRAEKLFLAGRAAGSATHSGQLDGVGKFLNQLRTLRAGEASDSSAEVVDSAPRRALVERLHNARLEHQWRSRLLGVEPWPDESSARTVLNDALSTDDCDRLLRETRERLGGRLNRHGQEVEARLFAARALECAGESRRAQAQALLAHAYLKLGEWDLALAQAQLSQAGGGAPDILNLTEFERALSQARAPGEAQRRCERAAARVAALERALEVHSPPRYASASLAALDDRLAALIDQMESWSDRESGLLGDTCAAAFGWGMERRRRSAEQLREHFESRDGVERWRQATKAIRESPLYGGLELSPQVGLTPLGPDPRSGLWEFAHLLSGETPTRGPDGDLERGDDTAIVLVLTPGGERLIGAQSEDPRAALYVDDADESTPVSRVRLAPYFLSKYELTQSQWARVTGQWPSRAQGDDRAARRPVASVSWWDCTEVLRRYGLSLPTEMQWESACRAGGNERYARDERELSVHANFYDASGARDRPLDGATPEPWDDGVAGIAVVGAFNANAYGLHDMHGNVAEWCMDSFADYTSPTRAGDGLREAADPAIRIFRGGSFATPASQGASATRSADNADIVLGDLGCRAARALDTR